MICPTIFYPIILSPDDLEGYEDGAGMGLPMVISCKILYDLFLYLSIFHILTVCSDCICKAILVDMRIV